MPLVLGLTASAQAAELPQELERAAPEAAEELLHHMKTGSPLPEILMKVYGGLFLDYCILGGMPAVVRQYIQSGTFEGTLTIQRQLLEDYKEDIRKYADGIYTFPYFCAFLLRDYLKTI